jgi:hypothetical protein
MHMAYSMHEGEEDCIYDFGEETRMKEDTRKTDTHVGRMLLN